MLMAGGKPGAKGVGNSRFKRWSDVLQEQEKELMDVDSAFIDYMDGGRQAISREYGGRRMYPNSSPVIGSSALLPSFANRVSSPATMDGRPRSSTTEPTSFDDIGGHSGEKVRPSLSAPPSRDIPANPTIPSIHGPTPWLAQSRPRPVPTQSPTPGVEKRRSTQIPQVLPSSLSPSGREQRSRRLYSESGVVMAGSAVSALWPRRVPYNPVLPGPWYEDSQPGTPTRSGELSPTPQVDLESPLLPPEPLTEATLSTLSRVPSSGRLPKARAAELMTFPVPTALVPSIDVRPPTGLPAEPLPPPGPLPVPWQSMATAMSGAGDAVHRPSSDDLESPKHRAATPARPVVEMRDQECQTDAAPYPNIALGSLDLGRLTPRIDEDVQSEVGSGTDEGTVSPRSTKYNRQEEVTTADSTWKEEVKVWVGQVRLNKELPGRLALRQLLYGDAKHTAKDADVIALFFIDLVVDKKRGYEELRNRFATVVDDPEDYIFNEEDEGLAIPNVPALRVTRSDGVPRYAALYCCVNKRCVGDWEQDGRLNFMDVFPLPLRLACRASVHEPGKKHAMDAGDRYILMQDVMLAKKDRFMHLKLMGANLDSHPKARLLQVLELEREFTSWHRDFQKFAAIIFGDFGSRVVCDEQFSSMIEEDASIPAKKEKSKVAFLGSPRATQQATKTPRTFKPRNAKLTEEGAAYLCNCISSLSQRRSVFLKDSIYFTGKDAFGTMHKKLDESAKKLREMFTLHLDLVAQDPDYPVPLPTYRRMPMDTVLSQRLGFKVSTEELITRGQLDRGSNKLRMLNPNLDPEELYLPAGNRTLRTNLGPALLLQGGWLDGVGVYKNGTVPAELVQYDCDASLLAFDHVPVKGTVLIKPGGGQPDLRVWVGAIKLDRRHPERSALQHFMYGHPKNSAKDADVIALYFTDLHLDDDNISEVRHLLKKNVLNASDYVYNEEDPGLQIKNIPAILVKVSEGDPRYVALFVCVHKRNVGRLNHTGGQVSFEDTFPLPASLMCRSHLKNDLSPNFKAHLVQDALLFVGGKFIHLSLFGLNFDTSNVAQLGQVVAMERCMDALHRDNSAFTAIAFGDFNNRLVITSDQKQYVKLREPEGGGKPIHKLSPAGVSDLIRQLTDTKARRNLFLTRDSWVWTGVDGIGNEIKEPPLCFTKLSNLFHLHRDLVAADPHYDLPMPTYKRTPIGDFLSRMVMFKLNIKSLITMQHLCDSFKALDVSDDSPLTAMPPEVVRTTFFGGPNVPIVLDTTSLPYPVLDVGWPDGVGVYRGGPLLCRLESWGTATEVLGGEHVATRATVIITFSGSSAMPSLQSMNGRVMTATER